MNEYLSELQASQVRSLAELVEWNQEHADDALTSGPYICSLWTFRSALTNVQNTPIRICLDLGSMTATILRN